MIADCDFNKDVAARMILATSIKIYAKFWPDFGLGSVPI